MNLNTGRSAGRGNLKVLRNLRVARLLFLITLSGTGFIMRGQQVSVDVTSKGPWVPGNWSRVDIEIRGAAGSGPSRLQQDFPVGFIFRPTELSGGTFFQSGTTVNFMWSVVPSGRSIKISYEVFPERSLAGGVIEVAGWFYRVSGSNQRSRLSIPVMKVVVGPENPERVSESVARVTPGEGLVFRIQLLSSSSRLSDQELKRRLGVTFREKVTVVHTGGIYKYQAGDCKTYECALALLDKFRSAGVEGVFMVAWLDGNQITIEQARSHGR